MSKSLKLIIMVTILVLLSGVYMLKNVNPLTNQPTEQKHGFTGTENAQKGNGKLEQDSARNLPMLLELGSDTCEPCRMMKPILGELRKEYEGKVLVENVDIYANRDLAVKYGIRVIPTQIFLDSSGEVVFRHEGYMPKGDIIEIFREMGIE